MTLQEYTQKALSTLTNNHSYGEIRPQLMDQVLRLVGESREVAKKLKK